MEVSVRLRLRDVGQRGKHFIIANTNSIRVTKTGMGHLYVHLFISLNAYTL